MGFQVSPGVEVKEIDLTNVIPAVSTSIGGFSGYFKWGPINEISLLSSEKALLQKFGTPDSSVLYADPFFQAASFLEYGDALKVVRAGSPATFSNATDNGGADNFQVTSVSAPSGMPAATYGGANSADPIVVGTSNAFKMTVADDGSATIATNVVLADLPTSNQLTVKGFRFNADLSTFAYSTPALGTGVSLRTQQNQTFTVGGKSITFEIDNASYGENDFISIASQNLQDLQDSNTQNSFDVVINTTTVTDDPASPADSPVNQISTDTSFIITVALDYLQESFVVDVTYDGISDDGVYIPNETYFEDSFSSTDGGTFAAKYAGAAGNGLKIYALNRDNFNAIGTAINSSPQGSFTGEQEVVYNSFDLAPDKSGTNGATEDEVHIAVVDVLGNFGVAGSVIELFAGLSLSKTSKTEAGATNYIKNVINAKSRYIYLIKGDTTDYADDDFDGQAANGEFTLSGAIEASALEKSDIINGMDLLADVETVDVNLLFSQITAEGAALQNHAHKIAYQRKDAVAFLSPPKAATVGAINPLSDVLDFNGTDENAITKRDSDGSYGVMDSGAVYIYDRYNDVYRFIPANGHVAGLCANTDDVAEPWFSPAGFNRGGLRSIVKLAFNPTKAQRDELYKAGINPIASFPGTGTVLFGDKTAQAKPSAFDRINVRRLFIVLEKAIATAAKFQLFELNDEFTRATFRNAVEPFLRDVQGRRGITDFMVVCDDTNNTGEVIDTNRFVADIYIKPARSINFITLNFIATRTGVDFSEVAGLSNA